MLNTSPASPLRLMLIVLALLLTGCANAPPNLPPPPVVRLEIPPLPQAARQPTPPAICSQSCLNGLTKLRVRLADTPIKLGAPASSASAPTTP